MAAREIITIRLGEGGLQRIDTICEDHKVTRSELIRAVLAEALKDNTVMVRVNARLDTLKGDL